MPSLVPRNDQAQDRHGGPARLIHHARRLARRLALPKPLPHAVCGPLATSAEACATPVDPRVAGAGRIGALSSPRFSTAGRRSAGKRCAEQKDQNLCSSGLVVRWSQARRHAPPRWAQGCRRKTSPMEAGAGRLGDLSSPRFSTAGRRSAGKRCARQKGQNPLHSSCTQARQTARPPKKPDHAAPDCCMMASAMRRSSAGQCSTSCASVRARSRARSSRPNRRHTSDNVNVNARRSNLRRG